MHALDEVLPAAVRPYSDVLLGAGAGALIAHFGHFGSAKNGMLYGAGFGLAVSLLKPKGSGGHAAGDSVMQFPTRQLGYAQPYQSFAQPQQAYAQVIPGYAETPYSYEYDVPEWSHEWRRPDWHRYGHEWRGRGWGHHW